MINLTSLPLLNGLTVRQFLDLDNELLGGGPGVYGIDAVEGLTASLNGAFENGTPSIFAQQDLIAPSSPASHVPEPSAVTLLGSGLALLALRARKRKCRYRCLLGR